jgi:prepilin-type N-terminal cleavage/methylation domain-containing protein
MRLHFKNSIPRQRAFTLAEVIVASLISAVVMSGVIYGYVMSTERAEWASYFQAAQSLAIQRLEQTRAAKWEVQTEPQTDELQVTNFPVDIRILDIPLNKTNIVYATNYTTISTVSLSPPLRMIRVDTTWRFWRRGIFTNTIITYRAPDQ